jgi:predicted HTH domain antitoxin
VLSVRISRHALRPPLLAIGPVFALLSHKQPLMRKNGVNYYLYSMKQLTLTVPDELELNEVETKRFLAAKLYEIGKLSLGQAAELAGLSKVAFSEILIDFDVSIINYPPSDIIKDAAQF